MRQYIDKHTQRAAYSDFLLLIYTKGEGELSYFWCPIHMLTVPPLGDEDLCQTLQAELILLPACSRHILHPPHCFTTAHRSTTSLKQHLDLIRYKKDNTILKRARSQVPAQIHLSAMDWKAALERAPRHSNGGSFWEEGNTTSAMQVQSPQSEGGKEKNPVISSDCVSLHSSAFSCRDPPLGQLHLFPSTSEGWIKAGSLTLP